MIQFIHEDIYNKRKESLVSNLLEMTLIYSKKQAHICIYTSENKPKYFARIRRRRNSFPFN